MAYEILEFDYTELHELAEDVDNEDYFSQEVELNGFAEIPTTENKRNYLNRLSYIDTFLGFLGKSMDGNYERKAYNERTRKLGREEITKAGEKALLEFGRVVEWTEKPVDDEKWADHLKKTYEELLKPGLAETILMNSVSEDRELQELEENTYEDTEKMIKNMEKIESALKEI
ncbi:MAG: hypothetical protein H8Z69_01780 [Nanohaloarchaea archaeon]|nr:hypothetical protein [Candidatus Nanohaloarchaea archaeon]